MNYIVLKQEVITDPDGVGYDAMSDEDVSLYLNTKNIVSQRSIPIEELVANLFQTGGMLAIAQAVLQGTPSAILADRLIKDAKVLGLSSVDFSLGTNQGALSALLADGVLSQAQVDSVVALTNEIVSRAEELGIGSVSVGDVQAVRM